MVRVPVRMANRILPKLVRRTIDQMAMSCILLLFAVRMFARVPASPAPGAAKKRDLTRTIMYSGSAVFGVTGL